MAGRLLRRIRGSARLRGAVARLIAFYIRICRWTGRWEVIGAETRQHMLDRPGPWIMAIWHGRLFMVPAEMHPAYEVQAMISRNRDGDIISDVVGRFGIRSIRGSSEDPAKPGRRRGGPRAFREAAAALDTDRALIVAVTPDGPRGPRMRCRPGVAALSAMTAIPVVPWTFSARWAIELGSWDRFLIPLPFTRGVLAFGTPIPPPADEAEATLAAHGARIENELTGLTLVADTRVGRSTPIPGNA